MMFRMLTLLMTISALHCQGTLFAGCGGCSRGQSIVTEGTAAAAAAALPGLPGAAGLPTLAGAPGAPGLAGPPGSVGLAGGLLDYAIVYGASQNVPSGNSTFFNLPDGPFAPSSTFSHVAGTTDLVINTPGTYLARYVLTVSLPVNPPLTRSDLTTFSLALGGTVLQGSDRSSDIPVGAGELTMVGEVVFRVVTGPQTLTVTNAGTLGNGPNTSIETLDATGAIAPAGTAVSLFIQKLSSN